jgi:hypothetical protein
LDGVSRELRESRLELDRLKSRMEAGSERSAAEMEALAKQVPGVALACFSATVLSTHIFLGRIDNFKFYRLFLIGEILVISESKFALIRHHCGERIR